MDGATNGCTFQWKIENTSPCLWFRKQDHIESPTFIATGLEDTKWSLGLYPLGAEDENYVGLYLSRKEDCVGPDVIEIEFQLAFVAKDGSFLREITVSCNLKKGEGWGFPKFMGRERVFLTERGAFLQDDSLTVQCMLRKPRETIMKLNRRYARTVLKVHRKPFKWTIDKFSSVRPVVRSKFKDDLMEFDMVLKEDSLSDKELNLDVRIEFRSFSDSIKYISCDTSIINNESIKEHCGFKRYFLSDLKKGIISPILHFPKGLEKSKTRYFPNNTLTLDFEFVLVNIEHFSFGKNSAILENNSQSRVVLIDELKSLCNDGNFSDIELRTPTKIFPAHKAILSARSPVFRNMFSHDMKEQNSGQVDITDFEDDIVHRMLLFIYTADIEDPQFESAYKLYAAADKYDILSLKRRCSSFLMENLCPGNACDVLVLADLHSDDDMKNYVQDYIIGQRNCIFRSQEWKDFMNNHSKLAADLMYQKIYEE